MKIANGWINQSTPPHGYYLDDKGIAKPHSDRSIAAMGTSLSAELPPAPPAVPVQQPQPSSDGVPASINITPTHAGAAFDRRGNRNDDASSAIGSVATVTINGRNYISSQQPIFDRDGNQLN
jgi:hypothetical protein